MRPPHPEGLHEEALVSYRGEGLVACEQAPDRLGERRAISTRAIFLPRCLPSLVAVRWLR